MTTTTGSRVRRLRPSNKPDLTEQAYYRSRLLVPAGPRQMDQRRWSSVTVALVGPDRRVPCECQQPKDPPSRGAFACSFPQAQPEGGPGICRWPSSRCGGPALPGPSRPAGTAAAASESEAAPARSPVARPRASHAAAGASRDRPAGLEPPPCLSLSTHIILMSLSSVRLLA